MQCKYYQILLGWTCEWSLWRGGHFIEVVFKTGSTVCTLQLLKTFLKRDPKLALTCEYGDNANDQIRDQVIISYYSSQLRTKLLSEHNFTLNRVSEIGRTMEMAEYNIKLIEESNQL